MKYLSLYDFEIPTFYKGYIATYFFAITHS